MFGYSVTNIFESKHAVTAAYERGGEVRRQRRGDQDLEDARVGEEGARRAAGAGESVEVLRVERFSHRHSLTGGTSDLHRFLPIDEAAP